MYPDKTPYLITRTPRREEIVAAAYKYRGVRFRHQGRSTQGLDCIGLAICVARDLQLKGTQFDFTNYKRAVTPGLLFEQLSTHMDRKSFSDRDIGDVLLFNCPAYPSHVAIITNIADRTRIIHAYAPNRKVVENDLDEEWLRNVVACFAYRGI